MNKKILFGRSLKDILIAVGPSFLLLAVGTVITLRYVNPAPPTRIVISTGHGEGDYQSYAEAYRELMRQEGVTLEIRPSTGARENLKRLADPRSGVDVAFVQDGLDLKGPEDDNLVSLGSLYYEPMWIFYRGKSEITRLSQLKGKRLAVGERGGGTPALAMRLLKESGIEKDDATFLRLGWAESAAALKKGEADAAFFLATAGDAVVRELVAAKDVRLMSIDQAEAVTRHIPFLHHLVLPHGALDLAKNVPEKDVHLVATTATLVAKESFHPALIDLLLKAASQVHDDPGIFEKKNEFPVDKDYNYPISDEAKRFYKHGTPFWQRYLPFWLASLLDRFLLVVLPLVAVVLPFLRGIPKILSWRVRTRIHKRYGELKYLETQVKGETSHAKYAQHLRELDDIEDRVKHMKVPLDFAEHVYVLREHIDFVRMKLSRGIEDDRERAAQSATH